MWVFHRDAGALLDIPCGHVAEERALPDAAFTKDGDAFPAGGGMDGEHAGGIKGIVYFTNRERGAFWRLISVIKNRQVWV